ncbi:retrovirus-related pol polyprotein from transposon TNT 1-94 [Tanacetum coccineum]
MKKIHRLLSMTNGDKRKHVLDYTHVDLHYVEDQRKNLVNKFNLLKQELSLHKSKLCNLKSAMSINCSLQNEVIRVNLENESLKDEISDLKKEPLPKLIGAAPAGTSDSLISLADLTLNMVDLTLNTSIPKKTNLTSKADSSAEQLLLTLMEECFTCGSTNHLTKEHLEQTAVNKTLTKLKAQSSVNPSAKKAPMIPKPFKECKYCGFNDHHSDNYEYYLGCEDYLKRSVWYLDSGCSRHMTGVKQYLHRYSKESGPKVVFGDNSSGDTEGYGSMNYNGITFTRVAYVNGLKHNLISISQLCDANFKVLFTKTQGTIFNQNDEVVLIAPRRRDIYIIDMLSYNEESNACFFAKASLSIDSDYTHVDLHYVEDQRKNLVNKFNLLKQELSLHKSELQTVVNKTLTKLKAQSSVNSSTKKAPMIPRPFKECKYCGFNDHHSDNCEFYPGCEICGSIAHEPADCPKKHPNSRKPRIANKRSTKPTENGCSRHMTRVKQYLHRYSKKSGPKVVFGNDSSGDTEVYGLVNYNGITFTMTQGTIFNLNDEVVLIAPRKRDVYIIDMSSYNSESNACFYAKASPSVNWLWRKRLSHLNFKNINNIAKHNLVSGLPSLTFSKDKNCSACEKGKHHRASFKTKRSFSINKCLHLLHMDLFGPVKPQTISHNKYTLVIVDEYSKYTWVFCLKKKSDAAECIMSFIKKMENFNEVRVKELRSDNGTKFRNHKLEEFCDEILKRYGKTAYDVFRGRSPDISYFHVFGCPVHIHNHRDHLGKFDEKSDDGFFLGYSLVAKAFRVFNIRRQEMEETVHVTFSEDDQAISKTTTEGDDINFNENMSFPNDEFLEPRSKATQCYGNIEYFSYIPVYENITPTDLLIPQDSVSPEDPPNDVQPSPIISPSAEGILQPHVPHDRWSREKHIELVNIIGEPFAGITTRSRVRDSATASAQECLYVKFLSKMEPKKLIEALEEERWIIAMQEELNQFETNKLMINYEETFAPVARLKAIRIFLAYAAYMGFMVYQMDVKSAFLNGKISEEVYVQQPPGFESSEFPNHVCKLDKAPLWQKQT